MLSHTIKSFILWWLLTFCCTFFASAGTAPKMTDALGHIDVFALRKAVARLEALMPQGAFDYCQTSACRIRHEKQAQVFRKNQKVFMNTWGKALLSAIAHGDEVAEVIWLQCSVTPVIERSSLVSTCDTDTVRQKEARQRLRAIGFEAAIQDEPLTWEQNQGKRNSATRNRVLSKMRAGNFGEQLQGASMGGNMAQTPEMLDEYRLSAALTAASVLVRRAFTYASMRGDIPDLGELRLNRKVTGVPQLAWSGNVFHSGSPYTGLTDPLAIQPFKVYLTYTRPDETFMLGGPQDTLYLKILLDILRSSEKRIDDWLQRDPRWAVFLLHRHGHHEWIPEGTRSPFGNLEPSFRGEWVLDKQFVNLIPTEIPVPKRARIESRGNRTAIRFSGQGGQSEHCHLRYSGATSLRPNVREPVTNSALGYLPHLGRMRISLSDIHPIDALAPLDLNKVYRQVLVQCPQAEWPNNRNVDFVLLVGDTLVEIRRLQDSQDLIINHWQRSSHQSKAIDWSSLPPDFDLKSLLVKYAIQFVDAQVRDAEQAALRERQLAILAHLEQANVQELIASLAVLRNERLWYSPSDFPGNLTKLIATPGVAEEVCAAYRKQSLDHVLRFNLMLVLARQIKTEMLTLNEIPIVADCMRQSLDDPHPWIPAEVLGEFGKIANEADRPAILRFTKHPDEDVRMGAGNGLLRLDDNKTRASSTRKDN